MAEPLERVITDKILKALRARGGWWKKIHGSPYSSGLPDIIGCWNGQFVGLEVKRPSTRNSVTPGQQAALAAILDAGGVAGVVTSPEEALVLVLGS